MMFIKKYKGPVNPFALPGLINDYKMNLRPNFSNADLAYFFKFVTDDAGISQKDVLSFNRKREKVFARQVFCHLAKKYTKFSLKDIGIFLNGRDHTTVIHSLSSLKDLMDTEEDVREHVERLERKVRGFDRPDELAYEVVGDYKYFRKE